MELKRWDVTVALATRFDLRRFVEIGVKGGKHVAQILKRVPEATVVAVDPWAAWSLQDPNEAERQFDKRMAMFPGRVTKHKMTGVEAAALYPDKGFDFVFIDDDHTYAVTKANIEAWLPKVCSGGILAGHDIANDFPGVDKVVREKFHSYHIEPDHVWWVQC